MQKIQRLFDLFPGFSFRLASMEEQYIVSARKYRPDRFDNIVGQEALTHTLKTAILSRKMAHAYLFCGPRGVGKTTAARVLAKTINCFNRTADGEACNECESCRAFNEQRSLNVYELDAASNNSVEDIRQLISEVNIPPALGDYKVYIIDEVHMLSQAAFNAFLKTLEEPPEHVIFILATTEKHKILPTILSRCQIYDFRRITVNDIVNHLAFVACEEHIQADTEALNVIAEKADGGMRDALSLFDRIASYSGGHITYRQVIDSLNILDYTYYFRLLEQFLQGDYVSILATLDELLSKGFDGQVIINGLAAFFRDLMVAQHPGTEQLLEKPDSVAAQYKQTAAACPAVFLYRAIRLLTECDLNYRQSSNKRLHIELCLMQIAAIYNTELSQMPATGAIAPQPQRPPVKAPQKTIPASGQTSEHLSTPVPATSTPPAAKSEAATSSAPDTKVISQTDVKPQAPMQSAPSESIRQMPEPPAVPAAKTTNGGNGSRRTGRLSVTGWKAAREEEALKQQEQAPKLPEQHEPVKEEEMQRLWLRFAHQHVQKEQTLLIMAMEQNIPTLTQVENGFPVVKILLPNFDIENRLKEYAGQLQYFFCKELRNSDLTLSMEVDRSKQSRIPVTGQEKMDFLKEKSPAFGKLCEGLGLQPY